MKLLPFTLRRLRDGLLVLWAAASLTFLAVTFSGGDTALAILGDTQSLPTPELLAQVRAEYGLDQPVWVQYGHYLGRLAQGDLGESYRLQIPVSQAISEQLGATLQLAACAGLLAVLLALASALLTAGRGRRLRALASGTELVLSSTPSLVSGLVLLWVFAFELRLLPPSGSQGWQSLVLPTVALALPVMAVLAQVLRHSLEDVLEQPFISQARARGMSDTAVRLRHALRHALVPLVTLSGYVFASLLGGAVVVELLFGRQGIGRLMLNATSNKDVPLVLGVTLLAAAIYVLVNLLVDVLNQFIDPRSSRA
ncbi:ABC transporter permease [Pseudomonas sp. 21LCFQ02]|uniref:ABC transporter permease n=1 Tax=unclassified Pseudomonas TaxID=196821 RepID=UPI0004F7F111|nr:MULTISPECIES: ABC transporter permease [unclassified Pseudomonas]MCO8168293.1 ABC transporter permease [Pseudomonas sp. 21LCFQ02]BAP41591.1 ABC transporter permease [Pseudomonas sp. StFLB209]